MSTSRNFHAESLLVKERGGPRCGQIAGKSRCSVVRLADSSEALIGTMRHSAQDRLKTRINVAPPAGGVASFQDRRQSRGDRAMSLDITIHDAGKVGVCVLSNKEGEGICVAFKDGTITEGFLSQKA